MPSQYTFVSPNWLEDSPYLSGSRRTITPIEMGALLYNEIVDDPDTTHRTLVTGKTIPLTILTTEVMTNPVPAVTNSFAGRIVSWLVLPDTRGRIHLGEGESLRITSDWTGRKVAFDKV